jgi:chemotaxis protein methyltransferase CheR
MSIQDIIITDNEFILLRDILYRESGIYLTSEKTYLIQSRLKPLLSRFHISRIPEFIHSIKNDTALLTAFIDALTTNETCFFRERHVFNHTIDTLIPHFFRKKKNVRIWSAAASTGQEAYSLAMGINELYPLRLEDFSILGTDISAQAIATARRGEYTAFEIRRGLTDTEHTTYFTQLGKNSYRITPKLQSITHFKTMNILKPSFFGQSFDIIFCRNVAIYFNEDDTNKLFETIHRSLYPGGILIIGATESHPSATLFEKKVSHRTVYYQKK